MSGGAVFQEVLRIVARQSLPDACCEDLLTVLETNPREPLEFLYRAGVEAGLPSQQIISRAAALYFNFCAGSVCDDLSDGDCTYLADPYRTGPCIQLILQTLFLHALGEAGLPNATLSSIGRELTAAVGSQHVELRTKRWTAPLFRQVAEGLGGRQWSAYLKALWCGTPLAARAETIGARAGIASFVVEDIQSRDRRYTTLSKTDRCAIVNWAIEAARTLRAERLFCIDAVLRTIVPVLERAI